MAKHNQDLLDRIISGISIRSFLLHPATLFVLATIGVIGSALFLWEGHQDKIVNDDAYCLTDEKITVTPQPIWAKRDLKQLIVQSSAPSSLLDTNLVPRTADAFRNVGFVERVRSIEKSKSGLDIELIYRQPIALVELSKETLSKRWPNREKVLLPVDRQGVLMPESAGHSRSLPVITIPYPCDFSKLKTWGDWPDERIQDAVAIGSTFEQGLTKIGISIIYTTHFREPEKVARASIPFELWTGTGTKIVWGNAPGKEVEGEASVAAKLSAINSLVAKYDILNKVNLGRVDVRTGKPMNIGNSKTASVSPDMSSKLK